MKFPTGGGQVLEHNRQADNEVFCRKSRFEATEILCVFQDFKLKSCSKRTVTPTARAFTEIARQSASASALNRCDSDTDSKGWMEEEWQYVFAP